MFYSIFLAVIYQWVSYKESHLYQTKYCHMWRALFVLGLTAISVVGELGAENHHDYPHRVLILFHVVSFCDTGLKNKFTGRNQEHKMNWNSKP
jgi:hypothetical protein